MAQRLPIPESVKKESVTTIEPLFSQVLLDYRIAALGITPRITPAATLVRLRRSIEAPLVSAPKREKRKVA